MEKDFAWGGAVQENCRLLGGQSAHRGRHERVKEYVKSTSEDGLEERFPATPTIEARRRPSELTYRSQAARRLLGWRSTLSFALKPTTGSQYNEPYRFYNLDVQYDLDVPWLIWCYTLAWAVSPDRTSHTAGVFYNNPSETFVDVS